MSVFNLTGIIYIKMNMPILKVCSFGVNLGP